MPQRNSVLFAAALAGLTAPVAGLVHDGPRRVAVASMASPSMLHRSGVPSLSSPDAMALKPAKAWPAPAPPLYLRFASPQHPCWHTGPRGLPPVAVVTAVGLETPR